MISEVLNGRRILVVEDEYLIANDLEVALTGAGAEVVGPFPTVADAIACLDTGALIDAAILDVNLRGEMIFEVADALNARGVPFLFATGYDHWSLPERFADAVRLEKPLKADKIASAIGPLLHRVG